MTSLCSPGTNSRKIFPYWEKLRLGNHSLSDRTEHQVHSFWLRPLYPQVLLCCPLLGLREFSCEVSASPHWKIILPSLWLISGAASAYSNLQDLHWPVLGGTKSKMWAEGWRESLQPSCHTDLHMQLPLPTQLESSLSWFLTAWTGRRGSEWHLCFPVFRVCINEICRLAKQS